MHIKASDEFHWFFRAVPVAVAISALAYCMTKTSARPAPSNAAVFGCYSAPRSPMILLDASGMHVRQQGYPVVPFHLERSKTGIVLTADAPIRADKTADGYRFGMDKRGSGLFLPFYRIENGRTYGVADESLLKGFQMLGTDDAYLNYEPTDPARCT